MNFIETLRSVGGVKPCPIPNDPEQALDIACAACGKAISFSKGEVYRTWCSYVCYDHAEGVLDLAPLLAKPKELRVPVEHLIHTKCPGATDDVDTFAVRYYDSKNIHVIGPQRASNLVYECTRQLGVTAVTASIPTDVVEAKNRLMSLIEYIEEVRRLEMKSDCRLTACFDNLERIASDVGLSIGYDTRGQTEKGYRLSIPIPDDATVLFVTDRLDEKEMQEITQCVSNPIRWLPYILALVSDRDELVDGPRGAERQRVIALHKERE